MANAGAVPGLRGAGVIFTNTLLARLEVDEIVAICAHELAHLEHTATVMPIGSIAGRFIAYGSRSPGWLTGWLDSMPAAFRVITRDAIRVQSFPPPTSIAAGVDAIGTVSYAAGNPLVRVYRY